MALIFAVGIFGIYGLPAVVSDKFKLGFFILCTMVAVWIIRVPSSVLTAWYDANKAERARNEALFLQREKERDNDRNAWPR